MSFIFNKKSQMVKDMLLLINKGIITFDDIPDVLNLREIVEQCLSE